MAQITINEGLAWLKTLKKRHEELLALDGEPRRRPVRRHRPLGGRPGGAVPADARAALAHPAIEHGIKANRAILETCADYSLEQGLTPRRMKLEEIFAPSTMAQ